MNRYILPTIYPRRASRGISDVSPATLYKNYWAKKDTAYVAGGIPIAVWSQSISGISVINPLVAFYDIHGRKRAVLFFYFVIEQTYNP
jgi:hypothetical protein